MTRRTCGNCHRELVDQSKPCPYCGTTDVDLEVEDMVGIIGRVTEMKTTRGRNRGWEEKWYGVRQRLLLVETNTKPGPHRGNDPITRDIEAFFNECFHLGDWLWQDQSTHVTERQVRDYIDNDAALRVCAAMANTTKHHTRAQKGAMSAQIGTVTWGDDRDIAVSIDWWQGANSGTEDALDLARRCVSSWERFLNENGLKSTV